MSEATAGPNKQPAEEPIPPNGLPASPSPEKKSGLSALLEWVEPYQKFLAVITTVVVSVSGGVAWIVAHFATQAELHYAECRIDGTILTQLLPIHMEEFAGKIEWRNVQIKTLAKQQSGKQQNMLIEDLTNQVTDLTNKQRDASERFRKEIDEITKNCMSETPQLEKAR